MPVKKIALISFSEVVTFITQNANFSEWTRRKSPFIVFFLSKKSLFIVKEE